MNMENITISDTLVIALVGFAVVFVVLIALMGILIRLMKTVADLFGGADKAETAVPAPAAAAAAAPLSVTPAAPASISVKLENVSDREAAMVMAIVADELKKDPAELNFISIKEVK